MCQLEKEQQQQEFTTKQQDIALKQQQQQNMALKQQQQQQDVPLKQQQQDVALKQQQQQQQYMALKQQQQPQQQQYMAFKQQQQQRDMALKQQQQQEFKQQQQQNFLFEHPFTCLLSGPTSCGKTYLMKELLQRAHDKIQPCPERIIWLYKRWQPLYDEIMKTVLPRVEFIKGVPLNLEHDSFLNPAVRNLIVLDDMATEASKDPRITDLFTEGSHHRNLSVIALNQNLYFNKNPTQRRNCHYIILFNNPVDKQSIMTLARQMYPHNHKVLLNSSEEAVSQPYGSLILDLKPTTPEHLRMRTNIFAIKENGNFDPIQFDDSHPSVQTPLEVKRMKRYPLTENTAQEEGIQNNNMPSCDDCGVVFENAHDLQNHFKRWCPEQKNLKRHLSEVEYLPVKKMKYDASDVEDSEEGVNNEDRETEVYSDIAEKVKTLNERKWQQKVEKYESEGMDTAEAKEKADIKLRDEELEAFIDRYGKLISYIMKLSGGYLHSKVMNQIEKSLERNMDEEKAIRLALRKYKHTFEEYLDSVEEDDASDNNDTDEESDTDNDSE